MTDAAPADMPFDRTLRRLRRDRAARSGVDMEPLLAPVRDELLERLAFVTRSFSKVLMIGAADPALAEGLRASGLEVVTADAGRVFAGRAAGVQCDEDRLAFGDAAFDLVMAAGVLDGVNDLPGALTLIRRVLRPDGLFLAALAGAGSLPHLKTAMLAADIAAGGAAPRIHPQIDVRAAGDLLLRAGFLLPVVDSSAMALRYKDLSGLVRDLRALGATNIMRTRSRKPITRAGLAAAAARFAELADEDGRTTEQFAILHLSGWAPP